MNTAQELTTRYGDLRIDRQDIRDQPALSLDMRSLTSDHPIDGDDRMMPPGTFTLSLFAAEEGDVPVGEIRLILKGVEVSLVGHLTGRTGVVEVTPEHLTAAASDDGYRGTLVGWITGAES